MAEILRVLARRPQLLTVYLLALFLLYGTARLLLEREWGDALFCSFLLGLVVFGIARAVRKDLAESTRGPARKNPPPIDWRQ